MRVVSMTNKMVHFSSSSSSPEPGQIFTVGSISWVINADGDGDIINPVQIDSAPTTPTPATADPILEPPPRSFSPTTRCLLSHYSRKQVGNDDPIASIDLVGQKLIDCLSLMESALTTLVRRKPPFSSDLSEADRETPGDTATIHQDALRDKFTDQITSYAADQPF